MNRYLIKPGQQESAQKKLAARRAEMASRARENMAKAYEEGECATCGAPFVRKAKQFHPSTNCPKCRDDVRRENDRERHRRNKEAQRKRLSYHQKRRLAIVAGTVQPSASELPQAERIKVMRLNSTKCQTPGCKRRVYGDYAKCCACVLTGFAPVDDFATVIHPLVKEQRFAF